MPISLINYFKDKDDWLYFYNLKFQTNKSICYANYEAYNSGFANDSSHSIQN
jgi:hypothetical protein